tara:strand:- start:423 stop:1055 length:633 start_codon:yes stop_codon:yes gene_type:complete
MRTCYDKHPTWKHIVWTYENRPKGGVFEKAWMLDKNPARRSDLLRLEVLYLYGGVYLDTDMECIKPIDDLLVGHEMIMASECSHIGPYQSYDKDNCDQGHINNAIIASTPGNRMIKKIMDRVLQKYGDNKINTTGRPLDYVAKLSGPYVYNEMRTEIERHAKIYPNTYFYPIHYSERIKMKDWKIPTNTTNLDDTTHMIHHFAASWYNIK